MSGAVGRQVRSRGRPRSPCAAALAAPERGERGRSGFWSCQIRFGEGGTGGSESNRTVASLRLNMPTLLYCCVWLGVAWEHGFLKGYLRGTPGWGISHRKRQASGDDTGHLRGGELALTWATGTLQFCLSSVETPDRSLWCKKCRPGNKRAGERAKDSRQPRHGSGYEVKGWC